MPGPSSPKPFVREYDRKYKEAENLYNEKKYAEAREAAEQSLWDSTLPRYHIIQNHILYAHASDEYKEAEEYRRIAERVYREADTLTPESAIDDRKALRVLRAELDRLAVYQREDLDAKTDKEARLDEVEDEDEGEDEDEDQS